MFIGIFSLVSTILYGTLLTLATINNTGMPVDYTWTAQNGNKFTNRVEVKEGESIDLDALANQLKGTYEYRDWWKVESGENKIENSNKYTPNGTQETLYVRYVAVMTLDSLNSKGLPVNFSWTDPLTKEKHDNTNKFDVLKGLTPNKQISISNINGNAEIVNFATLWPVVKGNYTWGNNHYSDPQGTTLWGNGDKLLTQNTTIYGYLYSQVTLDSLKSRGIPVKFSFTDSITKVKVSNVNYLRVLKGETINGAIARNLTNGDIVSLAELSTATKGTYRSNNIWFTDSNGSEQYIAVGNGIPEGNMTLYGYYFSGIWINSVNNTGLPVNFEATDSIMPDDDLGTNFLRVIKGDTLNETIIRSKIQGANNLAEIGNITKGNYVFRGWYNEAAGSTIFSEAGSFIPTGDKTIYAKYVSIITYNLNGTGNAITNKEVIKGQSLTQAGAFQNATGGNYTFRGWFSDNNTFKNQVQGTFVPTGGTTTLYAKWVSVITYNNNGAGSKPSNKEVIKGQQITSAGIPTLSSAYTFRGWCSKNPTSSGDAVLQASWVPTGNQTIFAKWVSAISWNYNGNGGTNGNVEVLKGQTWKVPIVNAGSYTFRNWWTASNFTGTSYTAGQSITPTGNMNIYAKWVSVINVYYNGGALNMEDFTTEILKGKTWNLPWVWDGESEWIYTFRNWYWDAGFTQLAGTYNDVVTPTGNANLYAKWVSVIRFIKINNETIMLEIIKDKTGISPACLYNFNKWKKVSGAINSPNTLDQESPFIPYGNTVYTER